LRRKFPVFVPAFTILRWGWTWRLNIACAARDGQPRCVTIPSWTEIFCRNAVAAKEAGDLTIGGGVPAELGEQFGPTASCASGARRGCPLKRYHDGVAHLFPSLFIGRAFGVALLRAISWGKFVPPAEADVFGEVFLERNGWFADHVMQRYLNGLARRTKRPSFKQGRLKKEKENDYAQRADISGFPDYGRLAGTGKGKASRMWNIPPEVFRRFQKEGFLSHYEVPTC